MAWYHSGKFTGFEIEPYAVKAAGLAEITGLSPSTSRMWRHQGHLPRKDGSAHSTYDCFDIARIGLICSMQKLGLTLDEAKHAAENWIVPVVCHMFIFDSSHAPNQNCRDRFQAQKQFVHGECMIHRVGDQDHLDVIVSNIHGEFTRPAGSILQYFGEEPHLSMLSLRKLAGRLIFQSRQALFGIREVKSPQPLGKRFDLAKGLYE